MMITCGLKLTAGGYQAPPGPDQAGCGL